MQLLNPVINFSFIIVILILSVLMFCASFQESCKPVMTAYKLVTVDAPYWGFGSQLEQAFIAVLTPSN